MRHAQRASLALPYQAPPPRTQRTRLTCLNFIFWPFNHKEWGKTTTKTEAVEPAVGIVLVAKCATGEPGIVEPSAPTNVQFNFHFLTFLLLFTKSGEKQQRKPTLQNRWPGACLSRHAQRALQLTPPQAPPRTRLTFLVYPFLITKNGEKQQRKPTRWYRKPGESLKRYAQRAFLSSLYQAPPRIRLNFIINLSFNYKEWGKTTTKTATVVPSAPTNSFKFHCLSFFNYKEWEKT